MRPSAVPPKPEVQRSPHWPAVRAAHLQREPLCQACGTTHSLEVHHKQPFHLHPDLELDDANLITLCEQAGLECHYVFGHNLNWHGFNPHVVDDVALFRQRRLDSDTLAQPCV